MARSGYQQLVFYFVKTVPQTQNQNNSSRSFIYGSIGHIIGHELSHSLDTIGRDFDANGTYREWWEDEWIEQYDQRANCYARKYSKVTVSGWH
ncbi:hypothetical protein GCK32_011375 [Trichostrongylus colubriformis]|uniref:Peptidase M13 C-terminal domain-containing protein n=1 Tax=Trichostrongylus colubriformis TaxID=6319 RepID=A0AAN8IE57_TRICO